MLVVSQATPIGLTADGNGDWPHARFSLAAGCRVFKIRIDTRQEINNVNQLNHILHFQVFLILKLRFLVEMQRFCEV